MPFVCVAQPADAEKASALNGKAIAAYNSQRYLDAIDFWFQAYGVGTAEQKTKLHKNIGLALHKLERLPEAWHHLDRYIRLSGKPDDQVQTALEAVESVLRRTYVKCSFVTSPAGAEVVLPPGDRLHRVIAPVEWWLTPGEHSVEVGMPGYVERKETILVASGAENAFAFTMDLVPREGRLSVRGGAGSKVLVEGKVAGDVPFTASYPKGQYAVEVVAPDGSTFKKVVAVEADQVTEVVVPVKTAAVPVGPTPGLEGMDGEGAGPWPWVLVGTGVAIAAGGGVLYAVSASKNDEAGTLKQDSFPDLTDASDPKYEEYRGRFNTLIDDRDTYFYSGVGVLVVGAGAVAAGVIWLLSADAPARTGGVWGPGRSKADVRGNGGPGPGAFDGAALPLVSPSPDGVVVSFPF